MLEADFIKSRKCSVADCGKQAEIFDEMDNLYCHECNEVYTRDDISNQNATTVHESTYSTQGMECPYCNHVNQPDDASDYDECIEIECGSCEKVFYSSCHILHSWSSKPLEGAED